MQGRAGPPPDASAGQHTAGALRLTCHDCDLDEEDPCEPALAATDVARAGALGGGARPRPRLADVRDVWEGQARSDPLWAILSEPDKRGGRWDLNAFFAEGTAEISRVMERVLAVAPDLPRGLAVDFGCGVGRLSQPLATYFDRVVGVDISPTMIELARRFDRSGGRVDYVENNAHDLRFLDDAVADLVYSNIVLQHVGADLARAYLGRVLPHHPARGLPRLPDALSLQRAVPPRGRHRGAAAPRRLPSRDPPCRAARPAGGRSPCST